MNLFINAISEDGILILFNNNRKIISQQKIKILGNESSKLIGYIDSFLKENDTEYQKLENLVVVNGPGSFTGVRTIVLAINTINFIVQKSITPMSFFDLFENYPIIKNSSRRDLFVKYDKSSMIEVVKNETFLEWKTNYNPSAFQAASFDKGSQRKIYGDIGNNILSEEIETIAEIDYTKIITNIEFQNKLLIEPLYIKKPSIS